ncbi:MAG: hypothetical protein LBD03_09100 [Methanobrevibacter sp.]|jgi:hypothetical protein|nr:hypothetical protein [Candidatus Methanovirga procula]
MRVEYQQGDINNDKNILFNRNVNVKNSNKSDKYEKFKVEKFLSIEVAILTIFKSTQ